MKKMRIAILLFLLSFLPWKGHGQSLYFPPANPNGFWDTLSPQSLGWCVENRDSLYRYLEEEGTKAFLVLKDGKIVLEKYFGSFTTDSVWYWASAGKTLTSFLVGKAKEENLLRLTDSSSRFLGPGWSSLSPQQEGKIQIIHQLTMTTGLEDNVPDNHCTLDTCLLYRAAPGTRWAYHNAPYTLLDSVLRNATNRTLNQLTAQYLRNTIGLQGIWVKSGYNNLFLSRARSMARFGILALNDFNWNGTPLLSDTAFVRKSLSSSQSLNPSYGYLWWLNGKSSFIPPSVSISIPGSWAPDAPSDLVAALGKNGQMIGVSKSKGLVFVRMGNNGSGTEVPFTFCNEIWKRLNRVICSPTSGNPVRSGSQRLRVFPNPANGRFFLPVELGDIREIRLSNLLGAEFSLPSTRPNAFSLSGLPPGVYRISIPAKPGFSDWLTCLP